MISKTPRGCNLTCTWRRLCWRWRRWWLCSWWSCSTTGLMLHSWWSHVPSMRSWRRWAFVCVFCAMQPRARWSGLTNGLYGLLSAVLELLRLPLVTVRAGNLCPATATQVHILSLDDKLGKSSNQVKKTPISGVWPYYLIISHSYLEWQSSFSRSAWETNCAY